MTIAEPGAAPPGWPRRGGVPAGGEAQTGPARLVYRLFRYATAAVLFAIIRLKIDVAVFGKDHISGYHPTLMVANHKRHVDSVVLITTLSFVHGATRLNQRLCFALNEVWFSPQSLARFLGWSRPWSTMAQHFGIGRHLRFLNAWPVSRFADRTRLDELHSQLGRFAALLDRGYDVLWTPEGGLATDGTVQRFRAGLHRIVVGTHTPLHLAPVGICYDFMTTGRVRSFLRIGEEVMVDRRLDRLRFEEQVRAALVRNMTVNLGHLAAAALRDWAGYQTASYDDLERRLLLQAHRLRLGGCQIDPRLSATSSFRRRFRRFLAYAAREGVLSRCGNDWQPARGLDHPDVRYALNELQQIEREYCLRR